MSISGISDCLDHVQMSRERRRTTTLSSPFTHIGFVIISLHPWEGETKVRLALAPKLCSMVRYTVTNYRINTK